MRKRSCCLNMPRLLHYMPGIRPTASSSTPYSTGCPWLRLTNNWTSTVCLCLATNGPTDPDNSVNQFIAGIGDDPGKLCRRNLTAGFDRCGATGQVYIDCCDPVHPGQCLRYMFLAVCTHHTFDFQCFFHHDLLLF